VQERLQTELSRLKECGMPSIPYKVMNMQTVIVDDKATVTLCGAV
jgi:hypothetical protein